MKNVLSLFLLVSFSVGACAQTAAVKVDATGNVITSNMPNSGVVNYADDKLKVGSKFVLATSSQSVGDSNASINSGVTTVRITAAITGPRTYTLPAASAYKTGRGIEIISETSGYLFTLVRAGSDTILVPSGSTGTSFSSTATKPGRIWRVISDGVSKWTVVTQLPSRGDIQVDLSDADTNTFTVTAYSGVIPFKVGYSGGGAIAFFGHAFATQPANTRTPREALQDTGLMATGGTDPYLQANKQTTTLGSPAASITFTVPAGYTDLRLTVTGRVTGASSSYTAVGIRLNGDTNAIHYTTRLATFGGAFGGSSTVQSYMTVGFFPSGGSGADEMGYASAHLPNYLSAKQKQVFSLSSQDTTDARFYQGKWSDTSAVTSITIYPAADTLDTGTTATLIAE